MLVERSEPNWAGCLAWPVTGGGSRGAGTALEKERTAVAEWQGRSNLQRVSMRHTRGKSQRRSQPGISSRLMASPSHARLNARKQCSARDKQESRSLGFYAPRLSSPRTPEARRARGLGRSRPRCRGMHSQPLINSLQEPPPRQSRINYPAQQRGPQKRHPGTRRNQVRNSGSESKACRTSGQEENWGWGSKG